MWGTFLFTLTILNVTGSKTGSTKDGAFNGLIICMALFVSIILAAKTSGACINPAVALGLNLGSKLVGYNKTALGKIWVYFVGELAGALVAGLFYKLYHEKNMEPSDTSSDYQLEMEQQ